MEFHFSPFEQRYSSPFGRYPSPESDTLQTPFEQKSPRIHNLDDICIMPEDDFAPLPALFEQSTNSPKRSPSYSAFPIPEPIKFDIDASFINYENPADSSHDSEAISVVLSNPKNLDTHPLKTGVIRPSLFAPLNLDATLHSSHFPFGHKLNPHFVRHYQLEDELGAGGYGFVMTARHRVENYEVAVKFIIKSKVPDHAWMEDETIGKLPTEIMLLSFIEHENIVKCLDVFEDSLYFYLIQELHGSPWPKYPRRSFSTLSSPLSPATPGLSPSFSISSLPSSPGSSPTVPPKHLDDQKLSTSTSPSLESSPRPSKYTRRPSHDLFECIEQSEYKRLSEKQARYVFSQVVDAVYYLDSQGVTHRDIKDENLVIDRDLKVKLIDFGSAAVVDPNEPRPYYTLFYGTTAYASPEILLKQPYQAPPAEIWTLGVLLSYLLTGTSPFPTVQDAINGRIVLSNKAKVSKAAISVMRRCLDPNPKTRATISQVKAHRWFSQLL
ncbi:hypothetical protein H0H92_001950 [Tricholoma furcatifolium]|nr:hypothetical protein H0H92_001950 [Tricholoma furcatifolium]